MGADDRKSLLLPSLQKSSSPSPVVSVSQPQAQKSPFSSSVTVKSLATISFGPGKCNHELTGLSYFTTAHGYTALVSPM